MRITKQSSGERGIKGRGEYELCDWAEPFGLKPSDLVGSLLVIQIGQVQFETGVRVTKSQEKYRLRIEGPEKRNMQAVVQVASALLMPPVARGEDKMFGGELVLLHKGYVVKNMVFGHVACTSEMSRFVASVRTLECSNRTVETLQIIAAERMAQVEALWRSRDRFPEPVGELLARHEETVRAGRPIPASTRALICRIQDHMERLSTTCGIRYARTTDVVPALLHYLQLSHGTE